MKDCKLPHQIFNNYLSGKKIKIIILLVYILLFPRFVNAQIFWASVQYQTGAEPYGVAAGDFNGDNKPDLAVATFGSCTVSILLGNGDGTFQAQVNYPTGQNPVDVVVEDFNGDTKPDLAASNIFSKCFY